MILFLVESPTKIKTIKKFFKKKAIFVATFGHIKDLPKKSLGVDLESLKPSFYELSSKKRLIKYLKETALKVGEVYLATDPDREGEAISYHLYQILSARNPELKFKRLDLLEITKDGIERALKNPREIDEELYESWLARRVLDRLIGYLISPRLSKDFKKRLSAGRVQSVALRLVVEREEKIRNFVPQISYGVIALLKGGLKAELFKGKKPVRFKEEKEARELVANLKGYETLKVLEVSKKEEKEYPPLPLKTSTLIEAAQKHFGFTPKETMLYAQRLYENGYITYMRTDSVRVSPSAKRTVRSLIKSTFGEEFVGTTRRTAKSSFVQDAHECIRPTNVFLDRPPVSPECQALYSLIKTYFIASQMKPALFEVVVCKLEHPRLKKGFYFALRFKKLKFPGYKVLFLKEDEDSSETPSLSRGDELLIENFEIKRFETSPPSRYTQASLIKKLESMGIGRPSTYPTIFDILFKRKYIERKKGYLYPTPLGEEVCRYLLKKFPQFVDYQFTAKMEENLEKIAKDELDYFSTVKNVLETLKDYLSS